MSWYFLIDSAKSVKVPIELTEDCYCNLGEAGKNSTVHSIRFDKEELI